MSTPAIRVENLGKEYQLGLREQADKTFREALTDLAVAPFRRFRHLAGHSHEDDKFWALKDVSFDVQPGEVVGIIGRNGAGKSTLLKILSQITEPTTGRVQINGRVGSLLEVGTGFHPELTGRENVFLNGSILGMSRKEVQRKFDEIVDFSGVEKFLDTPVKRYSSGMKVRLAFAVAAHLDPEILIIDEVLAVGDAEFQKKCLGKMQDVAGIGRTILFVSHNMTAISKLCSRVILLSNGGLQQDDGTEDVLTIYFDDPVIADSTSCTATRAPGMIPVIKHVEIQDSLGCLTNSIRPFETIRVVIHYVRPKDISSAHFGIAFEDKLGNRILLPQTRYQCEETLQLRENGTIICKIEHIPLSPGVYRITVGCETLGEQIDLLPRAIRLTVIEADVFGTGKVLSNSKAPVLVRANWSS